MLNIYGCAHGATTEAFPCTSWIVVSLLVVRPPQLQLLPLVGFVIKFSRVLPIVHNCPATLDYRLGRLPEKA